MLTVGYIDSLSELGFRTPTPEWVKTERYDYCDQRSFLNYFANFTSF